MNACCCRGALNGVAAALSTSCTSAATFSTSASGLAWTLGKFGFDKYVHTLLETHHEGLFFLYHASCSCLVSRFHSAGERGQSLGRRRFSRFF